MIALTKFDILIKKSIQRALADGEPLAQLVSGVCLGLGCERWGSPFMLPGVAFVCAYMRPRGICADVHTLIAKRGVFRVQSECTIDDLLQFSAI